MYIYVYVYKIFFSLSLYSSAWISFLPHVTLAPPNSERPGRELRKESGLEEPLARLVAWPEIFWPKRALSGSSEDHVGVQRIRAS